MDANDSQLHEINNPIETFQIMLSDGMAYTIDLGNKEITGMIDTCFCKILEVSCY